MCNVSGSSVLKDDIVEQLHEVKVTNTSIHLGSNVAA